MASDELDPAAVFSHFVTRQMQPTSQDQDSNTKYNFNPESPANVSPVVFQGPHNLTVFHPKKKRFCPPIETPLIPNPRVLFPNPHQISHSEQPRPHQHQQVQGPRYLQQPTGVPSHPQLRHQRHSLQQPNMAQNYQQQSTEAQGHPQFPVRNPQPLYPHPHNPPSAHPNQLSAPHPRHPSSAHPNQLSAPHPRHPSSAHSNQLFAPHPHRPPSAHPNQLQLTTNPFYMSQYSQNLRRKVISDMNYKNLTSRSLKQALGGKNRADIGFSSSSPVSVIQKVCSIPQQNIPLESQKRKQDLNANFACELDRNKTVDQFHEIKTGQELARMCFSTEVGCQTDLSFPLDMEILVMPKEALDELVTANEDRKLEVEQGETGTNVFMKTETSKRETTNATDGFEDRATEVGIEETDRESLGPPLTGDQLENSSWMDKNTKPGQEAREISPMEENGRQDDEQTPEKSNVSQSYEEQSILESTSTQDYTEDTVESFNPLSNFISLMSCSDPYIEAELSFMNHQASISSGTQFLEHHYYGDMYQCDDYNSENENSELAWVKDQCNSEEGISEKAHPSAENNSRNSFHSEEDKPKKAFQPEEDRSKNDFHFKEDSFEIAFHYEKDKLKNAFASKEDKLKNALDSDKDKPKKSFHSKKDQLKNVFHSKEVKPKKAFHSEKAKPKNAFHSEEDQPKNVFHSKEDKPKNAFHSEEDQPKNVFRSKEDKPKDALDSEHCYTENSFSGNDVYLDHTPEIPSESEHASYYKKAVEELVSRQNSPSTSIVINQENNVSKSSSTSKIGSTPKNSTSQNKLDRREPIQNSNDEETSKVQPDHEYLGPSTSKKCRRSGSEKSVQKEKSDVKTSVEINDKPDILARKLSENLSENWNIPLLDALNVTKKCGFVGGIMSLEKRNSQQSLGKQNEGMGQDTVIECSTKTGEKRSSRGRLLKKKNLDITSQRSPKLPAKAPSKAEDKSKITTSEKRRNKSSKYICAECGTVFTRHSSYTRHCRAKSSCGNARNKQKQMIDHTMETQESPSKVLDETADRIDIDLDELSEVATAGQGDRLLKALDKQIVSHKRTAQKNSFLSSIRRKAKDRDIEPFRVPYPRVTARWTNEEQLLAVQGARKLGKDFKVIAQILGTKTESHVRSFFKKHKEKYDLDNAFEDLEESGDNDEGEDVQSDKEGGRPKLSISLVSKTKPRNETFTCKECNLRFPSEDALDDHIEMDWPECGELFAGSNPTAEYENDVTMGDENDVTMGDENDVTMGDEPVHHPCSPEVTSSLKPFNRRKRIPKKSVSRGVPLVSHPQEDIVTDADEDNFEPPGLLIRAYVDIA